MGEPGFKLYVFQRKPSEFRRKIRRWANGVVREWGQTDLAGFEPGFTFSALSWYALYLCKVLTHVSRDFDRILTGF